MYNTEEKEIVINGSVDYIFEDENEIVFVDFKTGSVDVNDEKTLNQLMIYANAYYAINTACNKKIIGRIYNVETNACTNHDIEFHRDANAEQEIKQEFIQLIKRTTQEDVKFTKCNDHEKCNNCIYKNLCCNYKKN
jgi:CRISPR/Cas system-associated exonuclease Cas4 (RecB family)